MRVALISDIHGNLISLEAVLADIEHNQIDQIICLGDVATLGPQPRETIARLRQIPNITFIMGNHDTYLLNLQAAQQYTDATWFLNKIKWCRQQLPDTDMAFIRTFLPHYKLPLPNEMQLFCFHGSPQSNTDILLPMTPPTTLDTMLAGYKTHVMAGGHTHIQMMRQHKGIMLINVGSVGMPFEQALFIHAPRMLPWAEYAILQITPQGISTDLRRVDIDLAAVRAAALNSTLPEARAWADNWMTPDEIL